MHHGAGTWEVAAAGGKNRMPHLLGPEVPSYNTTQQLLTGSTSRERGAQRSVRRELAAPIVMTGAAVLINPLLDAASCAVAFAKGLL
jgi:hypothetical protein